MQEKAQATLIESANGRLEFNGVLSVDVIMSLLPIRDQLFQGEGRELQIDLQRVSYGDTAGLALLVDCLRLAKKHQHKLTIHHMPGQMLSMAKLSGMDKLLPLAAG